MNRHDVVETRLTEHFTSLGADLFTVLPLPVSIEDWAQIEEVKDSRRILGVTIPVQEDEKNWIAPFCPDLFVKATNLLSDEDMQYALDAIIFIINREIVHRFLSDEERAAKADADLHEAAVDSYLILTEAHFRAIDAGV